jgi:hypothetical protein
MEELLFSLKHDWRFVDPEPLELTALSQGMEALHQKSGQHADPSVNKAFLASF